MDNLFGVVHRPMFDTSIFSVNQPLHIIDYKKGLEYPGIVTIVEPMFLDLLCYDEETGKGVFSRIFIDDFIGGLYEFKALTNVDLEELSEKESPISDTEVKEIQPNTDVGENDVVFNSSESFIDVEVCNDCKEKEGD